MQEDIEARALRNLGAESKHQLMSETKQSPSRGVAGDVVATGSTGLNLRSRHKATMHEELKRKDAQVHRLQETIVAL